jgi:hypothetical protein
VLKIISLLFCALTLSSCNLFLCRDGFVKTDVAALRTQLTQQKQLWTSKNLKTYAYTRAVFIAPASMIPVRVTVRQGVVESIKPAPRTGETIPPGWVEPEDKSAYLMEKQFDKIESAINGVNEGPCNTVGAEFDATYGFPKSFGRGAEERDLQDGFSSVSIYDFTTTP